MNSYERSTSSYYWLFRIIGIVPYKNRRFNFIPAKVISMLIIAALFNYVFVFIFGTVVKAIKGTLTARFLSRTLPLMSLWARLVILYSKRHYCNKTLHEFRQLWSRCADTGHENLLLLLSFNYKIRLLYIFYLANFFLFGLGAFLPTFYRRLPPLQPNGTSRRILPFFWYTKVYDSPNYEIVYTIHCITYVCIVVSISACNVFPSFLFLMCSGFFRILRKRLNDLAKIDWSTDASYYTSLIELVNLHQDILSLSKRSVSLAQNLLLINLTSVTYNIAITALEFIDPTSNRPRLLPILITLMVQLFNIQWSAECIRQEVGRLKIMRKKFKLFFICELAKQSYLIAVASYLALKLDASANSRYCIRMMIMRAQKPVEVKAGGIYSMSFESLNRISGNIYTFYTVLRNVQT
uniref:Odorant receptor n=1 Tax=Trichogramma kaykai TaxID=54128 RepID=A0ABD2W982_9HYME